MTRFDFTQEKAWEGVAILGPGFHTVRINDVDKGISSGKHPQVIVQLGNEQGEIRDWIVLTPASLGRFLQLTDAVGLENPGDVDTDSPEFVHYIARLAGRKVRIFVAEKPKLDGNLRSEVQFYSPATGTDLPADTRTSGNATSQSEDPIPF